MAINDAPLIRRWTAAIRRYFGLDLPDRDIELRFQLLPKTRGGKKPPLTEAKLTERLKGSRSTPKAYMDALLSISRAINRYPLKTPKRHRLNELLAQVFYFEVAPKLAEIAAEVGGIPEAEGRREMLDRCERTVAALVEGQQQVFQDDYKRSRFGYARSRERIYHAASRILELIRLEHRIRGLRYMPLPPASWQIANTVFTIMRAYEPVDLPMMTLAVRSNALGDRRNASLLDLFSALQAFHILDYSAWPEQAQWYIYHYCGSVDQGISVVDIPPEGIVGRKDCLVARCYQETPPDERVLDGDLGPTMLIDYKILADSIRLDYAELAKARADRNQFAMPARLRQCEPVLQTAIGYLLYRNISAPSQWGDLSSARQRHRDLRIYTGYDEVRAHLIAIFTPHERAQQSRQLSNIFAQRSAVIGEDDSATVESLWYVLYETEERMRIKTQETRFTNRLFIGNLLAYGFGVTEVFKPRIGKVNRIFRPVPGVVVIDVEYLANYASPVKLYRRSPQQHAEKGKIKVIGKPLASLLIHHPTRGWNVITPPQEGFWENTPVGIQTGRRVTLGKLGEAQDVTAEFYWFQVDAPALPDKPPAYPEPRAEDDVQELPTGADSESAA